MSNSYPIFSVSGSGRSVRGRRLALYALRADIAIISIFSFLLIVEELLTGNFPWIALFGTFLFLVLYNIAMMSIVKNWKWVACFFGIFAVFNFLLSMNLSQLGLPEFLYAITSGAFSFVYLVGIVIWITAR